MSEDAEEKEYKWTYASFKNAVQKRLDSVDKEGKLLEVRNCKILLYNILANLNRTILSFNLLFCYCQLEVSLLTGGHAMITLFELRQCTRSLEMLAFAVASWLITKFLQGYISTANAKCFQGLPRRSSRSVIIA